METEIVLINENDETNPILSYQWKCITNRIKYESKLTTLQFNNINNTPKSKEQERNISNTIQQTTNNTTNETTTLSSTSLQVSNEPANTENYTQETTQQIDTDDDDFF